MKTHKIPTLSAPKTARSHPEQGHAPRRSGAQQSFLIEDPGSYDFEQDLAALRDFVDAKFLDGLEALAPKARASGRRFELLERKDFLKRPSAERPSLQRLRRHAMRRWFEGTLENSFDASFQHKLQHLWMPFLVGESGQGEVSPILVQHLLDYVEGYTIAQILAAPAANLVPGWRAVHALRSLLDLQRGYFGLLDA